MDSYVYIVKCSDGSFYTGWTNRPLQRIKAHSEGKGAKYTKGRGPVTLAYLEELDDKSAGLIREAQIKKMSREQKQMLIQEASERTKELEQKLIDIESEKKPKNRKSE
ncbi:MAG: GIY-YIG nuclease family protein [Firmicutes bacterium]|nr:GIY-YIG nuclease family protein [Bacillota bacterium]